MADIRVGISAWTEKTLLSSGWYPRDACDAAARLVHYAQQFSIVENDSTYYAIPPTQNAELWAERTPEGFVMNVKAFATLTEHYTDPRRLPKDLREALPAKVRGKLRVYPKDLGPEMVAEIVQRFRAALAPLAGRLGLVLFQYPVWLPCGRASEAIIARATSMVPEGGRAAIEFRNATWMSADNRDRTLAFLRDHHFVYTCVDEPQGFPSSVPPVAAATSDVALVRFHGRSAARWHAALDSASERFRYFYRERELAEWVPRVRELASRTRAVHVIMNNCYRDYAVINAKQMMGLLGQSMHSARAAG